MNQNEKVRCLIIGSGPAGYTAAIYASRANLSPVLYEGIQPGGQLTTTTEVENFPGYPKGITGLELMEDLKQQASRFGADIRMGIATAADLSAAPYRITIDGEKVIEAETLIIATGATAKYLGLPDEQKYAGMGVSACATCDGFFYRKKVVAVVGGGNTAAGDALFLARICKKVFIIHRRDTLRASRSYWSQIENNDKIEPVWNSVVEEIVAENNVKGIVVRDLKTQRTRVIDCDGVFAAIGRDPNTELFRGQVNMDENGYLLADETTKTNIPGVFAAGDVRVKQLRQIVTAVADGAQAAYNAEIYITESGIQ